MVANRTFAGLVVTAFLLTAFSGCFADDPEPASASLSTAPSTDPGTNSTNTTTNGTTPSSEPLPPVANFTVTVFNSTETNLTAGTDLIFNASASTDPAGGNLSYVWSFGDNATGEGVAINHTYAADGNYTVNLSVTSDSSGLNASLGANLTIVAGKPKSVTFTDPSNDGTANYYDIRIVTLSDDGEHFKIKFTTAAVQPSGNTLLVTCWELFLGSARFEVDSLDGYGVYHSGNDYVTGATVRVVGTGYEVTIPLAYLVENKLGPPLQFRMESRPGVCYVGAGNSPALDKAPDSGTVAYG